VHERERYRQESQENWQSAAAGWERWQHRIAQTGEPVARWLVEAVDPRPGQTILDVAAGTGDTALLAARRLAGQGRVILVDQSEAMLAAAARRAAREGLDGILETRVMDAHRLDLPTASVDGATCRFGYMLMDEPDAALRETARVLRAGALAAFAVWAEADRNPWAFVTTPVLVERGHLEPPSAEGPGMFALGDPGRLSGLVSTAGLDLLKLAEIAVAWNHRDFDEYWEMTTEVSMVTAHALDGLPAKEVETVRALAHDRYDRLTAGGNPLPGVVYVVAARRRPR
jgi:ubiquinone/menaquinone biosynthesis C-methylase UbiE